MPSYPMLSAGHMGIVDALKYGVTRDYATLAAALAAIGSNTAILLVPKEGDGVWTVATPLTFPANVTLVIAPGVHINNIAKLTILGPFESHDIGWATGTGGIDTPAVLGGTYVPHYFGSIVVDRLGVRTNPVLGPQASIHVQTPVVGQAVSVRIEELSVNGGANVAWYSNGVVRGILGLGGNQDVTMSLQNSARFIVANGNVGLGMVPTRQLQLSTDSAAKPGSNTWEVISDLRVKNVIGPYDVGLGLVLATNPVWYTYNGRGGMPVDGIEYVGIIAQDLQPHAPYMIPSSLGKLDPDDTEDTEILGYQGHAMTFALINAVKELAAQVSALTARVAALEGPS